MLNSECTHSLPLLLFFTISNKNSNSGIFFFTELVTVHSGIAFFTKDTCQHEVSVGVSEVSMLGFVTEQKCECT